jgi:hypothetical protein
MNGRWRNLLVMRGSGARDGQSASLAASYAA